jgi:hypothetical protein
MIRHKQGTNVSVHRSNESARLALADYCNENWTVEGVKGNPPDDEDNLISEYFEAVSWEDYDIDESELVD